MGMRKRSEPGGRRSEKLRTCLPALASLKPCKGAAGSELKTEKQLPYQDN
jgi:hypothetical protein